ncbi:MAG: chitinase [Legionella sp.]|nr:MAG: chitinase [Legionella sp.]
MRYSQILSTINGLLLSTNVIAASLFSPYVDLTLNTHWEQQTQNLEPMDLATPAQALGLKAYRLAFITDSGQCEPAWGGQQAYSLQKLWGKRQIDQLATQGTGINVSFGGANNNDISLRCDTNQLITIYNQVIEQYHADSLDFDIENGTANIAKILQALKVIQTQHPEIKISFTLPVMPEGLTSDGQNIVAAAKDAELQFHVNIMAMDYGPTYNGDMGAYAIDAATNLHVFLQTLYPNQSPEALWQMVEITPMIGVNDVSSEQFTLKNADQLKQFANENQIGALSMWAFTRDKPCADKWANARCSGNNLQSHDYEFIEHLR